MLCAPTFHRVWIICSSGGSISASVRNPTQRVLALSGAYLALAWGYCAVFLWHRGLWGETVFYELSQTRTWWQGFIYPYQATRPLMTVPYQIAYLLSNGSYVSLNILFALSVFATGMLTYVLVRQLVIGEPIVAYAAGAIAVAHGADRMG